jgi:Cu-Zn family superoxide dismutase
MTHRTSPLRLITLLGAAALLAACSMPMHRGGHHGAGPMAMAKLEATRGNTTTGMVMFHAMGDHLMMHARVEGLKPGQEHGFHIHEKGDCSSGDGMSTGGHFDPTAKPHGPQDADHHAGDLPALKADANGAADLKVAVRGLAIGQGATDIVGRGLIVHAMPDDYKTQPTGNSGARIACAVIQRMP